ncbi:MAG: hypothetical protein ACHP83_03730 [Burkholderiales bacterium]
MGRSHYVFDYDAEPADERPTGFGQTNFGQSGLAALSTVAAPWTASEHSTFDQPSHAIERAHAVRERRRRPYVVAAIVLLAVSIIASAVTLAMR